MSPCRFYFRGALIKDGEVTAGNGSRMHNTRAALNNQTRVCHFLYLYSTRFRRTNPRETERKRCRNNPKNLWAWAEGGSKGYLARMLRARHSTHLIGGLTHSSLLTVFKPPIEGSVDLRNPAFHIAQKEERVVVFDIYYFRAAKICFYPACYRSK